MVFIQYYISLEKNLCKDILMPNYFIIMCLVNPIHLQRFLREISRKSIGARENARRNENSQDETCKLNNSDEFIKFKPWYCRYLEIYNNEAYRLHGKSSFPIT